MTEQPAGPSPSQTVGPFFHDALVRDRAHVLVNDLTVGERIRLTGRVLDGDGAPVDDAMVELWQPDANGFFRHPGDPNADRADPHFRGFGRSDTRVDGRFTFESIKAGVVASAPTPGQAPFANLRVFSRGLLHHLVTRLYFSDEPNDADPILSSIDPKRRATLIARREDTPLGVVYHFDVKLQGPGETVFFDLDGLSE